MKSVKNLMISTAILAGLAILFVTAGLPAAPVSGLFPQVREVPFPYTTIQEAIDAADDGDTVLVHPGTYTGAGNRDLDFNGLAITVTSEDPDEEGIVATTIIDCQGTASDPHRAFIFQSGEDANSVLAGFTIMNGYICTDGVDGAAAGDDGTDGEDGKGGAINCTGSSPLIRNCVINNCVAEGGWGGNGIDGTDGVDYDPGDPCAVPIILPTMPTDGDDGGDGGDAGQAYGGGIYCNPNSNPIIYNCDISNCRAIGGNAGSGGNGGNGGAGDPDATPPVPDASDGLDGVPGSSDADGCGGGIYVASGSTAAVSNCTVSNCSVSGGGGGLSCGGGIYYGMGYSGVVIVDVDDCLAEYGAGIYCDTDCLLTISGSDILNNTATADGAGIYCAPNCDISISGTDILNNAAAADGAGIYCDSDGMLTLEYCNVSQNTATVDGAGIYYVAGDALMLNNCNIRDNNSVGGDGAGIWYDYGGRLSLNNCDISGNTAGTGVGGGIYGGDFTVVLGATVVINSSTVSRNTAMFGGGICLVETDLTINGSNVSDNTAEYGGGVYWYNSEASINNCTVSGNSALVATYCSGGGFYCLDSSAIIKDCLMTDNAAQGFGGAMFLIGPYLTGGAHEITNCLITDNTAGGGGGGISTNWYAELNIVNCTIADNVVTGIGFGASYGGGLYCSYDSYTNIINSIIWGNISTGYSWQVAIGSGDEYDPRPSTVDVYYSNIGPTETLQEVPEPEPGVSDYFIYSTLDTSSDHSTPGTYGLYGWVGRDGIDRIIHYNGSTAYIHTVTIPEGANPHSHPDNPYVTGPIAPRTVTLERTFDLGVTLSHESEFYVDAANNEIYIGAEESIRRYVFNSGAANPVGGGPAGNYVFDSQIAPAAPFDGVYYTQSLAYDPDNDIWYAGAIAWNTEPGVTEREVYMYDGAQGPDGIWELAFTYTTEEGIDPMCHHDGMEFVNGYLFLADYTGEYIKQYTLGGALVNTYYHLPLSHELEGMGFGALEHFWVGSHGNTITEFGGGALQIGIYAFGSPICVEDGCTLNGWDWNPDSNSWEPDFTDNRNIIADPLFTEGYHLSQIEAGDIADTNSPCVDAGSESAEALGLHRYTTRTDSVPDTNIVDMGYHYGPSSMPCDLDFDGNIDIADLRILSFYWLREDCNLLDNCEGADFNLDTDVDFRDYAIYAQAYAPVDETPPEPDPSRWAVEPYAVPESSDTISMTATTAFDVSGVEYRFVCTGGGGYDSGWQDSSTYINTGLSEDIIYAYKVQTRDKSPRQNRTAWSVEASAYIDLTPPEPNPSEWETQPYEYYDSNEGSYYNRMEAVTANDISGVEYYFWCRTVGYDSGWQDSPIYNVQVPGPNLRYVYKVKTRDKSTHQNETDYSGEASTRE